MAINGGKPVVSRPFAPVHNVGREEINAAIKVIKKGPLSGFAGVAGDRFLGGEQVQAFEKEFKTKFGVRHAVTFNSATSALHGAIVALGIGPGDEVIVPPYTMSASATAILMNGAVPIFSDVDERTFCIDPKSVQQRVTKRTRAIMVVNLLGQAADFGQLLEIARNHNLKIIEDNAQSPGARWRGRYTGTIGDIGIFSLNVHKTIQTGEGGMLITDDDAYALRAQLCRNHGEVVVDGLPNYDGGPIFGCNYRMTEVTAAMARVQLRRLDRLIRHHRVLGKILTREVAKIPGLTPAFIHPDNTHVYHRFAIKVDENILGITRDQFVNAMAAEGFRMSRGYVKPIYLLPLFRDKKAFNNTPFPFAHDAYAGNPDYSKGCCPVTERLYEKEFTFTELCQHPFTSQHIRLFIRAIRKILKHRNEIA